MLKGGMNGATSKPFQEGVRAGLKCSACMGMALLTVLRPRIGIPWLLRGTLHAGVVFYFLGGQVTEIYGKDNPI
jgi:hypothetical protein